MLLVTSKKYNKNGNNNSVKLTHHSVHPMHTDYDMTLYNEILKFVDYERLRFKTFDATSVTCSIDDVAVSCETWEPIKEDKTNE